MRSGEKIYKTKTKPTLAKTNLLDYFIFYFIGHADNPSKRTDVILRAYNFIIPITTILIEWASLLYSVAIQAPTTSTM